MISFNPNISSVAQLLDNGGNLSSMQQGQFPIDTSNYKRKFESQLGLISDKATLLGRGPNIIQNANTMDNTVLRSKMQLLQKIGS